MQNKKINVLIFGLSALNSSIIEKLSVSKNINNIYTINADNNVLFNVINLGSGKELRMIELKNLIKEKEIDFAVIFNEIYSAYGTVDYFRDAIPVIGTTKKWFKLEEYKTVGKNFMIENGIKTPDFKIIKDDNDIKNALSKFSLPIVIKNNNIRAGFGTYICNKKSEFKKLAKKFLKEDRVCIAEKFIIGEEITQTYIWDTKNLIALNPVRDYKKLKEGNKGINTGSLGSYTPVELSDNQLEILNKYNKQMELIFEAVKPDFTGIFCTNLLFSNDEVYTLEFNMRPGIPEFETLLENMNIDVLDFFYKIAIKKAQNTYIKYKKGKTGCVVIVHKDYAKQKMNEKRKWISLKKLFENSKNGIKLYLNGACIDPNYNFEFETNKVLYTILNTDTDNPFKKIYQLLNTTDTKNLYYRKDIGA